MITLWMTGMHQSYTGGWTTYSNEVITRVGERLVRQPGQMLIMERDAFAPGSWEAGDNDMLFAVHNERSILMDFVQGDPLPSYEEGFFDRWEHKDRFWTGSGISRSRTSCMPSTPVGSSTRCQALSASHRGMCWRGRATMRGLHTRSQNSCTSGD